MHCPHYVHKRKKTESQAGRPESKTNDST